MAFLPRGEGIWTSQSSKVEMPGGLPGGQILNFRIDWRIIALTVRFGFSLGSERFRGFQSKKRPKNGIFDVLAARNMGQEFKKMRKKM